MSRRQKKSFIRLIVFILLVSISMGYAAIKTDLSINGTGNIKDNTWNVYFNNLNVTQGSASLSSGDSAATIDNTTRTAVNYTITLQPGDFYEFTVDVVNSGSMDAMIDTVSMKMDDITVANLPSYMSYSATYSNGNPIQEREILAANTTQTYKVRVQYNNDINPEDLPTTLQSKVFTFNVTYIQKDSTGIPVSSRLPMIKRTDGNDRIAFRSDTYRENIKTLTFEDEIDVPNDAIASWDVSANENGTVMAYVVQNTTDNTKYDLYIQGEGGVYANTYSNDLFSNLTGLDAINNIELLNTSKVINMVSMFNNTGYNSSVFTLDLGDNFDTSNVDNMISMFLNTGYNSQAFTLNLGSKFDTSKVTRMDNMFNNTGRESLVLTLDLGDKFDTSRVENMSGMFAMAGYKSPVFTLDLGNKFDTSSVTDTSYMFCNTGHDSLVMTLDLGHKFDTSSVLNMSYMFDNVGYLSPVFTLELGTKFDTSSVQNMTAVFNFAGYSSTVFTLNLGDKFDTSSVTNMSYMFCNTGRTSPVFTLKLGDKFDTSLVQNMSYMFDTMGYSSTVLKLNLGNLFDTSSVGNMTSMFKDVGYNSPVFTLNLGTQFTTTGVSNMSYMFYNIGNANTTAEYDLTTFDFTNVTTSTDMFNGMHETNIVYVKDATDQTWVINHQGSASLSTSNVIVRP